TRSWPWYSTAPPAILPGGDAISRMIDSAVTLLPLPDSPTTPRVLRAGISNDTPSTARTVPWSVRNSVTRSRTSSTCSAIAPEPTPCRSMGPPRGLGGGRPPAGSGDGVDHGGLERGHHHRSPAQGDHPVDEAEHHRHARADQDAELRGLELGGRGGDRERELG